MERPNHAPVVQEYALCSRFRIGISHSDAWYPCEKAILLMYDKLCAESDIHHRDTYTGPGPVRHGVYALLVVCPEARKSTYMLTAITRVCASLKAEAYGKAGT